VSPPVIGVTAPSAGWRVAWHFTRLALRMAGARPVLLTPGRRARLVPLDGLVVGGGSDVDPRLYGQAAAEGTRHDPERDAFELEMLALARGRGLPLLGICRGAQLLNVHLGGSLHQDLRPLSGGRPLRRTVLPRKVVTLESGSTLSAVLGTGRCWVNSLHSQVVATLGRDLLAVARDRMGLVQAIEVGDHPLQLGVQWHPEFMQQSRTQRRLFRTLARIAAERRRDPPSGP